MTTTVRVEAHCGSDKEVVIEVDDRGMWQSETLKDGEKRDVYAYDARKITVYEREKPYG